MAGQYSYGYLKEALKSHLDLEEDELEVMNINQRFHIFANEAIQQICFTKPKTLYFQFTAVNTFTPLVYVNTQLRIATTEEQNWATFGLAEPSFASTAETLEWYNERNIYLVGQTITMPDDFLVFAVKKSFLWTTYQNDKSPVTNKHIMYLSNDELVVYYAATYQIPYNATWYRFTQSATEDTIVPMPSDLALTIPIYVASVCLQQRNMNMAQSKRSEFELAVARCKTINFLENKSITPSFK